MKKIISDWYKIEVCAKCKNEVSQKNILDCICPYCGNIDEYILDTEKAIFSNVLIKYPFWQFWKKNKVYYIPKTQESHLIAEKNNLPLYSKYVLKQLKKK